jgi:hypothetical protein
MKTKKKKKEQTRCQEGKVANRRLPFSGVTLALHYKSRSYHQPSYLHSTTSYSKIYTISLAFLYLFFPFQTHITSTHPQAKLHGMTPSQQNSKQIQEQGFKRLLQGVLKGAY